MVHEGTQITQTTEGQGSADTLQNDIIFLSFIIYAGLHDQNATSGQLLAIFYFQVQISVVL